MDKTFNKINETEVTNRHKSSYAEGAVKNVVTASFKELTVGRSYCRSSNLIIQGSAEFMDNPKDLLDRANDYLYI